MNGIKKLAKYIKTHPWQVLAYSFLIFTFVFMVFFLNFNVDHWLDTDTSGELILYNLLAQEKKLMTTSWYYTTEIRILFLNVIFVPLFMVINNWHVVRILGTIICFLIMFAAMYYLCHQLHLQKAFPVLAALTLWPLSNLYFELTVYGLYYMVWIIIGFLTLGLVLNIYHLVETKQPKTGIIIRLIILGILTLLVSFNGLKEILILYLPLLIIAGGMILKYWLATTSQRQTFSYSNYWLTAILVGMGILAGIGLLINELVITKIFVCRNWSNELYFQVPQWNSIMAVFNGWLKTLGFRDGKVTHITNILHNGCCLLWLILLGLSLYQILHNSKKQFSFTTQIIAYYFLTGLIAIMLLYMFTNMNTIQPYDPRYAYAIFVLALPIIATYLRSLKIQYKKILIVGITLLYLCCGLHVCWNYAHTDRTTELRTITTTLLNDHYTAGYSTFWPHANVLTELSNGQIEMWHWGYFFETNGVFDRDLDVDAFEHFDTQCQLVAHQHEKPTGKIFLIFQNLENEKLTLAQKLSLLTDQPDAAVQLLFYGNEYVVYGCDSYEILIDALNN